MFHKGQTVYLESIQSFHTGHSSTIVPGVVKTVGSKFYTVERGPYVHRFDKETLREEVKIGGPMYNIFSSEQAVYDSRERFEIYSLLRFVAMEHDGRLSLDQLRRIKAILEEGTEK